MIYKCVCVGKNISLNSEHIGSYVTLAWILFLACFVLLFFPVSYVTVLEDEERITSLSDTLKRVTLFCDSSLDFSHFKNSF